MMINKNDSLSLTRQCELVEINKSSLYNHKRVESDTNMELMQQIDILHTKHPYFGARRIQKAFSRKDLHFNIKRIRRLMVKMGILTHYPKKNLSKSAPGHKKYPYLLRNLPITRNNQVWSTDITYIPMKNGFMYLTAIVDWHSRFILSWKLSNTMTIEFCKECLQEAIDNYGLPEIFNSDQGCQFTSEKFIKIWEENNLGQVKISMDGKGRATDNAFIERVWRSVKQEKIYSGNFKDGNELWIALVEYFNFYNNERQHQSLDYLTPAEIYFKKDLNILTYMNKEKEAKRNLTLIINE